MLKAKLLGATAGAEAALAIEDVFSTYLYTGNGSTQTITNGIDLAGEGGLVWIKPRVLSDRHLFVDTERGSDRVLASNSTNTEFIATNPSFQPIESFNSDGFTVGAFNDANDNGDPHASWTFRKAERFFDVVTYTGTGSNRTIAHNLGVVPGCIIVKRRDDAGGQSDWQVYHRGNTAAPETDYLVLNSTAATVDDNTRWNDTLPTSTVFSLGTATTVNASGGTYVAYLFAHDPLGPSEDGSDGLIACGSFTTDGSGNFGSVSLGWEPQYVLFKKASGTGGWFVVDSMRGITSGGNDPWLGPNTSNAESGTANLIDLTATGFFSNSGLSVTSDYIYIAIRRGPMRVPESGTEVFAIDTAGATSPSPPLWNSGFVTDFALRRTVNTANSTRAVSRLTGEGEMFTNLTNAEGTDVDLHWDYMNGFWNGSSVNANQYAWMFRRAPGFFDVVAYTGDGASNRQINHNLSVPPELTIIKNRDTPYYQWFVRCSYLPNPNDQYFFLNLTNGLSSVSGTWLTPTDTTFGLGIAFSDVNGTGLKYISYHFASLPGISKVGSYTGNGSSQTINCGFTTGARFILIKRTDSTGDWYVWDTARGIVTGNDPFLELNTTDAEVTSDDSIDPDSSGFIVNQTATTNVNVSSASYIFMAIS